MVAQNRIVETEAQREDRMLHRAMLKNTQAEPVKGARPIYRVWSETTPVNTYYLTDGNLCTCPWNHEHYDRPNALCSHMAYVRFLKTA